MTLYHYDVYLKASHGTVKRMVSISKRSVREAGRKGQLDVQRTAKEPVKVIDVVPLRCIKGKATSNGRRGRKHELVTKARFVQSRRPKARASLKLTRKGKLYTPKWQHTEEGAVYQVGRVSEGLSEKVVPQGVCESQACIDRGTCTHNLPSKGKHFLVLVEVTKRPQGKRKLAIRDGFVWVQERHVTNRAQAAEHAVAHMLSRKGVVSVKVLDTFTHDAARKQFTNPGTTIVDPRNYFRSR